MTCGSETKANNIQRKTTLKKVETKILRNTTGNSPMDTKKMDGMDGRRWMMDDGNGKRNRENQGRTNPLPEDY